MAGEEEDILKQWLDLRHTSQNNDNDDGNDDDVDYHDCGSHESNNKDCSVLVFRLRTFAQQMFCFN